MTGVQTCALPICRIIFQARTSVEQSDTAEDVEKKVHELEREHFARVIDETLVGG